MNGARRGSGEKAVIVGGLSLALAGCLAPWVDHKTAGLAMTGLELGEFAVAFPHVIREFLYVPWAAALVSLALATAGLLESRWRVLLPPLCAAGVLAAVFPYTFVTGLYDGLTSGSPLDLDIRYMGQAQVAVAAAVLALLAVVGWRLPKRLQAVALALIAAAGAGLGLWQYAVLLPSVTAVYGRPVPLGWGLFASGSGLVAVAAVGALRAVRRCTPAEADA
ncbi:MAG: hypothetical protein E3J64_02170 [Anaerolineales bacterium]|nr:MAG: hypothetical protein E3J64_02170 [Anaerolineales bacterium]